MTIIRVLPIIILSALLIGCKQDQTVQVGNSDDQVLETQEFQAVMKTGDVIVDPEHGKEVAFWYGALTGEEGINANGVGFTHKYEDGATVHTSTLNIAMLKTGNYVAWLATDAKGTDALRIGPMKTPFGDVRHSIEYTTKESLDPRVYVLITQETTESPQQPGKVVAAGTLRKVENR